MKIIPIGAKPSQTLTTVLAGQNCKINIYQKTTGMYLDLYLNGQAIVTGAVCRDRVNVVRQAYRGFVGGLVVVDTQGVADPTYDGLGSRFLLCYLESDEIV